MSPPRYYPFPEPSRPIPVDGGIKARSRRGAIGEQWWSRRFIAVLESYGMSGRLQRGRNYARRGQVIEFELTQGLVTARVQGSRPHPYKVSIGVLPLTTAQWRAVERRLASQALFRAKLLAGEMPAEIEEVFDGCGTPLFPRSAADLTMRCSCPDWEVPCKHLAAVCYVLAEAFDDDPFTMLAWRGKGRDELLAELRRGMPRRQDQAGAGTAAARQARGAGQAGKDTPAAAAGGPGRAGGGAGGDGQAVVGGAGHAGAARAALADVPGQALAQSLADFYSPGLSPARLRALGAPVPASVVPDLLLRMSDPPAITVRGMELRDVLAPAYQRLTADEAARVTQSTPAASPLAGPTSRAE